MDSTLGLVSECGPDRQLLKKSATIGQVAGEKKIFMLFYLYLYLP
jgi:hypothetical protein